MAKNKTLPSTLGQLGDFLGLPHLSEGGVKAEVGHRVRITAAWLAGKTGTVTTLRIGYVRAFSASEANEQIVMLDRGSYVMLKDLKGEFEITGTTPHTSQADHIQAVR